MKKVTLQNISVRYITGDFTDIGLKDYVIQKLKRQYHVKEFWAVNDVSFSLEEGDLLGIVGSNGAGKSTLFNLITNFYRENERGGPHRLPAGAGHRL